MTSLTKNLHPQAKKFYQAQTRSLAACFEASTRSISGDVPVQSHVRLGVFFENPRKRPDAKVLMNFFGLFLFSNMYQLIHINLN